MSAPDLPAFHDHAARLESYIADAERRGEKIPEEARAMLASLREITRAMNDLRGSLGDAAAGLERDSATRDAPADGVHADAPSSDAPPMDGGAPA